MRRLLLVFAVLGLTALPARAVDKEPINRAIERGVAALKLRHSTDGGWNSIGTEIGGTALAGLTLLECDVPKEDKHVQGALKAVREASLTTTHTYSLALCVLFLDKYDAPTDTPLIESLIVRLLAGQNAQGGWTYNCPNLSDAEQKRVQAEMDNRRVLKGARDLGKLPEKGRRTKADLPPEVQAQLDLIAKAAAAAGGAAEGLQPIGYLGSGDNSNTQFATMGLWVGRRYGVPVEDALIKGAARFRLTQNADGGWPYVSAGMGLRLPTADTFNNSTPAMTCAGVFGVTAGSLAVLDKKAREDKEQKKDISKDASITKAIAYLTTCVGKPLGWNGTDAKPAGIPAARDRAYYYLWSLERMCMGLNLETVGKNDWYNWGAEILLGNQNVDGSWTGQHGVYSDTCFALLFLKKANLTRDLSSRIIGGKGANRVLKGGVGGEGLASGKPVPSSGIGGSGKEKSPATPTRPAGRPELNAPTTAKSDKPRAKPTTPEEVAAQKLGDELVRATSEGRGEILNRIRDTKGVAYTETLVWAIGQLDGDDVKPVRVALAERFTRLKDTTLREYLGDEEPEIRAAAAIAAAARASKVLVPDLIKGLEDREELVQRAAHAALKKISSRDFGPAADATAAQRKESVARWQRWWKDNERE